MNNEVTEFLRGVKKKFMCAVSPGERLVVGWEMIPPGVG